MKRSYGTLRHRLVFVHGLTARVDPVPPVVDPPLPNPEDEILRQLRYEADTARAESARIKTQLEEIRRSVPSDEQRARWAEMETQFQQAEEVRRRKEGEFDSWRTQIEAKHARDMDEARQREANAVARAEQAERELNNTLVAIAFANANEWFGPTGKTVLVPQVAQSFFMPNVEIEVIPAANGGPAHRRISVKDASGAVIVDPKSGKPMDFEKAIGELIMQHPQRNSLLKGSGKVGSGSAGGSGSENERDLTKLKAEDFKDPKVREQVRQSLNAPGGLRVGPGFDRLREGKKP